MKIYLFYLVFTFLLFSNINAKNQCYFLGGRNSSSFRTTISGKIEGYTWGIGGEWRLYKNFSICLEAFYDSRGGILFDKIVGGREFKFVTQRDIHCSIRFIEFPLLVKYSVPLKYNANFNIFVGPSLSIGYKDKSKIKNIGSLYEVKDPDEWDSLYYDYAYNIDPSGPLPYIANSSGFSINAGLGLKWSFLSLECRYIRDFFDVKTIKSIELHEKLHSIYVLLGIIFDFPFKNILSY